jgi:hypothetical protein
MQCIRCGKEMVNTSGGNYHCPSCNMSINDLVYRPSNCDIPMPSGFGEQKGWICPVCGRGLAPWMDCCPCKGSEMKITYGTSTVTDNEELNRLFELNDKRAKEMISLRHCEDWHSV